jgi:protein TonB
MKAILRFALLATISHTAMFSQTSTATHVPYEINIAPGVAEKLLLHKAPLACPHVDMAARVTATVVVAFEIDKNGNVPYAKVISGPQMLRKALLDAVRKYKYKPYIFNGKPVEVETTVSVAVDTARDCPGN